MINDFRAWDGKEYRYDFAVINGQALYETNPINNDYVTVCQGDEKIDYYRAWAVYEIKPEWVVEQSTGLKAINGKTVYEGDIVNIIDDGREYNNLTIKYSDERCGFIAENEEWKKFLYKVEFIEIVGNVNY